MEYLTGSRNHAIIESHSALCKTSSAIWKVIAQKPNSLEVSRIIQSALSRLWWTRVGGRPSASYRASNAASSFAVWGLSLAFDV